MKPKAPKKKDIKPSAKSGEVNESLSVFKRIGSDIYCIIDGMLMAKFNVSKIEEMKQHFKPQYRKELDNFKDL